MADPASSIITAPIRAVPTFGSNSPSMGKMQGALAMAAEISPCAGLPGYEAGERVTALDSLGFGAR